MRPKDIPLAKNLDESLVDYGHKIRPLLGLRSDAHRLSLIEQMLESIHRIQYVKVQLKRPRDPARTDPTNELFDPVLGAMVKSAEGDLDEACWLVFLSVHCGKHVRHGWRLAKLLYHGNGTPWTWARVSADPRLFVRWIARNQEILKPDGKAAFGNHRKYESLRPDSARPTGAVIESYVRWVSDAGGHRALFEGIAKDAGGDSGKAFDLLYRGAETILGFGRMGRFDFVTMLGKLELANVEPAIPYMSGATGPQKGAKLLFGGRSNSYYSVKQLDALVAELGRHLNLGMQVMEDSICNWQKSPARFQPFRG